MTTLDANDKAIALFDSRTPAGGRCEPVVGHACRESAGAAYVVDVDADAPKE
jgi:hypothetical protein